jgi:outer membrane protein
VLASGLLVAGASTPLHAQKICFVASEAIFDRLPDAKSARAKLAEMHASWMREIQRQEQEIQHLRDDIQANRLLWSTQEQHDAQTRLADLESKLTTYRTGKYGSNGEYEKTQNDLFGPIQDKVSKAIEEEARAQKYDFVFDKSSRGLPMLYANSNYDITYQVLKRLGVEVSASEFAPHPATDAGGSGGKGSENNALKNRGRREEPADSKTDPNDLLHKKDVQSPPNTTPPPQTPAVPPAKDGGATTP